MWHLYLVRTRGGDLYTGVATDVDRRLAEHADGGARGARFLRGRGPLRMVYTVPVGERSLALRLERRVKRLAKAGKERIVDRSPDLDELMELL